MNYFVFLSRQQVPQRGPAVPSVATTRRAAVCAMLSMACATWFAASPVHASGLNPYIGELMLFGGNFCPRGWSPAEGQILQIQSNARLYAFLGSRYGGDGKTTFALPDLRGRTAVGQGQGPGLTERQLGSLAGAETVTLTTNQVPAHRHAIPASAQAATHAMPAAGAQLAAAQNGGVYAEGPGENVSLATGVTGSNMPFSVRSPYLAMRWCIAVDGQFPQRP